jgi:hypothetical protein
MDCVLTQTTAPAVLLVDPDRNSLQSQDAAQGFIQGLDQQELSPARGTVDSSSQFVVTDLYRSLKTNKRSIGGRVSTLGVSSRRPWRLSMRLIVARQLILGVVSCSDWLRCDSHANMLLRSSPSRGGNVDPDQRVCQRSWLVLACFYRNHV